MYFVPDNKNGDGYPQDVSEDYITDVRYTMYNVQCRTCKSYTYMYMCMYILSYGSSDRLWTV